MRLRASGGVEGHAGLRICRPKFEAKVRLSGSIASLDGCNPEGKSKPQMGAGIKPGPDARF